MIEPTLDLQGAQYRALQDSVELRTFMGVDEARVYDGRPENPIMPYILIGDDLPSDMSDSCATATQVSSRVHVWSDQAGSIEIKTLCGIVRRTLDAELSLTEHRITVHAHETTNIIKEEEGRLQHGVLVFQYIVRPLA